MSEQTQTNPVELELELPRTALAGEWIPVLVQAKRPDNFSGAVEIHNVATKLESVQIDRDFLDRDTQINPGETYRFTVPIQVPTQTKLWLEMFEVQVHEVGKPKEQDQRVKLPNKPLDVRPSLRKEIKVWLEPICAYEEGTKVLLRLKHQGSMAFHKLTVNIVPDKAIFAGKSVVQRQVFHPDSEESIELVLKEKDIAVKVAVDVESQRVEAEFPLQVEPPAPAGESFYRFLEPRRRFDGQIEIHEMDASGNRIARIIADQNSWWPLYNRRQYQIVIRSKSGKAIDSVKFRDIPGVIFVRGTERNPDDGSYRVLVDTIANHWTGQAETLSYDVTCEGDEERGELPVYLHPPWWKPLQIAVVIGAAMTLQGFTSAVTKVIRRKDDLLELFTDFKLSEDYNVLFLLTIPVIWLGLWIINWVWYRWQS